MGNFLRALSERAYLVAGSQTWIEGKAIQQLEATSQLKGMYAVAGMPDLHPGSGYPIGAAFFSIGYIYPTLIGNDIGCGMSLWQTDILSNKFKWDKVEKQLSSKHLDYPLSQEERFELDPTCTHNAAGSIGGGNHFAEIQQIEHIFDTQRAQELGLEAKKLQLLVHSGSRSLGHSILRQHIDQYGHSGLNSADESAQIYLEKHNKALNYAQENRKLIALRLLRCLKAQGCPVLDLFHNFVTPACFNGQQGWLHRKGASPADMGASIIPGSRGDYSYLVEPLHGQASQLALNSLAHGAGRKWMRGECKGRLQRYPINQLKRSSLGSRLICNNPEVIYEEAPQAYKSIDSVIQAMEGAVLIRKIARLKPVMTYKTQLEN